jgi:7-cyano-7-deazaguanine synthase
MHAGTAVVLLSGGLDSATCLALARRDGYEPVALSFRYGQRHDRELEAASAQASSFGADHVVVDLDLRPVGGSALTDDIAVPKHDDVREVGSGQAIPVTYVPARNTVFLAVALGLAEVRGASAISLGVNAVDYSGYPDCRPEFLDAFEALAAVATKATTQDGRRIEVLAPLLELSKADIVELAVEVGVDLADTWSCYDPTDEGEPCRHCDSCLLRAAGFATAGVADPLVTPAGDRSSPGEPDVRS